jgi:Fur family ferric uptake transcriptional regulator
MVRFAIKRSGPFSCYKSYMNRRHSKKRDQILDVLKQEHGALSAAEIHFKLPELDLTTVYRNLDVFVADGEVKKLLLNGKEALYEYQEKPHHHAVCTECEKVIHFTAPDEKIKTLLGIDGFTIDELEVTVRGICNHRE